MLLGKWPKWIKCSKTKYNKHDFEELVWLLEAVLTINEVKQGRAVLVLGWVTARESMALAWKTRCFKPTIQATCCTVASSVYNTHTRF